MTNNLISNIHLASTAGTTPEVGMGVTVCHYSDRNAGTIVAIRTRKDGTVREFDVRKDTVTRTDAHGMSDAQSYTYAPGDESWPVTTWRLDGAGRYRYTYRDHITGRLLMSSARDGLKIALGIRDEFYDYSF